jgi:hypothetical protein
MLGVVAALLIVVGAVVVVTMSPPSFGWFAVEPSAGDYSTSHGRLSLPATVLSGRQMLGLVVVGTGLVLAGLAVGIRLGRRHIR